MPSPSQSYHTDCNRVKDLIQKHIFLHAMLYLSLTDFTVYTTIVSESITDIEKGILRRLVCKFQNYVLSAYRQRIRFGSLYFRDPDPGYNRQIWLLEDLNQKSNHVLTVFRPGVSSCDVNTVVSDPICEIFEHMIPLCSKSHVLIDESEYTKSYLIDSPELLDPQDLDTLIHTKRIESLEYFFLINEMIYIFTYEMQASYSKCQKSHPDLHHVVDYYENALKLAKLRPVLRSRIVKAMRTILPQSFRVSFDILVQRICDQAALTGGEVYQLVSAIAQTHYRRGHNEFILRWEDFQVAPFNCVEYLLRFRQLVVLSSLVLHQRITQWVWNHKKISFGDVVLSVAALGEPARLKIRILCVKYQEQAFTTAELKLYEAALLPVAPLSTKYVTQFNKTFTDEELWRLNIELGGEDLMKPLKWVYDFVQKAKAQI